MWPRGSSRPYTKRTRAIAEGYRSGLEENIACELKAAGIPVSYESMKIKYVVPEKEHTYTTDFVLPNGIIIETKGRLVSADRLKHRYIKEQHPELDIRFVFSNSRSRINKKSTTTYGMWAEKYGIPYVDKHIPKEWLTNDQP